MPVRPENLRYRPRERRRGASRRPSCNGGAEASLLELDARPGFLELALDRVGLFLVHALLDRLGSRVDEVLGLLEAEARDRADDLDHLDLLLARPGEDDVERRLLLGSSLAAAAAGSRDRDGGGGGDAPLLL